jgi:hypothetical protein
VADYIKQWQTGDASALKSRLNTETLSQISGLDEKINLIHEEVSGAIDCLKCANCCKTTPTTFTHEDVSRASKSMGMSRKSFIKKYLIDDYDEGYTTINVPCPFLNLEDNKCKIYDKRPQACHSFPHTGKKNVLNRLHAHINNINLCPIVFTVFDKCIKKIV